MPAGGPLFGTGASGADSLAQPAGSGFPLAAATPSLSARALPRTHSSSTEDARLAATGFPQFSAFAQQSTYFQPALFGAPAPPPGLQQPPQQQHHHQQHHQMAQATAATPLPPASQLSHGACAPGWWQQGPSYLPY